MPSDSISASPNPCTWVAIRQCEPKDVPDGTVGELIVRSPIMFSGYWNQPDTTARAMADGWYRTSDLGRRDADGYYYIVDRAKDMIITGGENVYSIEVERALVKHPGVAAVAVVVEPDEKWGEKVTAFVVLAPGAAANEDGLRAHCRGLIAGYKVPKSIRIESSLPMTASGKIQKAELRRRLSADLAGELARPAASR
jgi:acyl-CoA synthetase (AMP-forming)/AMP-acid ligase II